MSYIILENDSKIPTIQEAFINMYWEQDRNLNYEIKYYQTCNSFSEKYKLKPPYSSAASFKVTISKSINQRVIK